MHTELEDWKNGWYGVQLGILAEEIDVLIDRLQILNPVPDQHLHLSSSYNGPVGWATSRCISKELLHRATGKPSAITPLHPQPTSPFLTPYGALPRSWQSRCVVLGPKICSATGAAELVR
jgi:hypothetical protein